MSTPLLKTMLFSSLKTVNKLSSHKWKQVPVCLNKLWFFNFVEYCKFLGKFETIMSCEPTVFIDIFYTFYKTTLRSYSLHSTLNKAFIQHQSVQDFYNSLITSANVNITKKINQQFFKPVKIKRNMQPISTVQIY